jgi:putative ABC transport system permease protein
VLQLVSAYVFVVILLLIIRKQNIGSEGQIILANVRMTLQLILVGYFLTYIFENPSPRISLVVVAIMFAFAVHSVYARTSKRLRPKMKKIVIISLTGGTGASLLYFILIVINPDPWYEPHYFIPLAGMIIGNSMTGITLGLEQLLSGVTDNTLRIENALMLGGRPKLVMKDISSRAFYSAVLPTINSMMGIGIVFLPGMMTGQILAGVTPLTAIRYQIAIMLGILGGVTLSVYVMVSLGSKTFFNDRDQLNPEGE